MKNETGGFNVYKWLDIIRPRAAIYLGEPSLTLLWIF